MAIKRLKPTTPGRRGMTVLDFSELTKKEPEKSLTKPKKEKAGRSHGKISVRHRGGGVKRLYRQVDFKQDKWDIPAKVKAIEYDPNRSAFIALLVFADGEKRYIIAPQNIKEGDEIIFSEKAPIKPGNRLKLKNIPDGTQIYNIELEPGKGGQLARSAGTSAVLLGKDDKYAIVQLPSKETRKINLECAASIGVVSNPDHDEIKIGKAGRKRLMGIRPTVRGSAMYPAAHPHGGGEGKAGIGLPSPKTPWGAPTLGKKTRKPRKPSDKFIIKRRKK